MPFHCSQEEGIFVIRATGVIRMEDVANMATEEERYFSAPDCLGLFLCDCLEMRVISPDGADAIVERMRFDNPRVARSAFVVTDATAGLQLKRMLRDAGGHNRAIFATVDQAKAWLTS